MSSLIATEHSDTSPGRGSVSAFVVCLTTLMVCVAGLVADGGRYVAAHTRAASAALASARFGAQNMVDIRVGDPRVDCPAASRDARSYASTRGVHATVRCDPQGITVTVNGSVSMPFLSLFGVAMRPFSVERRVEPTWG